MITGEYQSTLDDKGRLLLPSGIRNAVPGNTLMITRGMECCLWLFVMEEWGKISTLIMQNTSMLRGKVRLLQRRIVAPARKVEIDKTGRITIPPPLRDKAHLKRDTIVLGIERYIEIWNEEDYEKYLTDSNEDFKEAAEELGMLF